VTLRSRLATAAPSGALLLALALAVALGPRTAQAQAWISEPGSGYLQLGYRRIAGDAFYDASGESQALPSTYTQQTLSAYAEVGVVPRWLQLSVQGELYRHNSLADQGATHGLGDLRVGAWTGLLQGRHNLAFGVLVGLPTGDERPSAGPGADLIAEGIARSLPTGDGEVDVTPTVAYGLSFGGDSWPLEHYLSATLGYQVRSEGIEDGLEYGATFGLRAPYAVIERVWWVLGVAGREALGESGTASFSGLGAGVSYTGFFFGLDVAIWEGLGLTARLEGALRASNVIAGGPLSLGLFWDF
jgi:hypothetical protein